LEILPGMRRASNGKRTDTLLVSELFFAASARA